MKRLSNWLLKNSFGIILLLMAGWFILNLYAQNSTYQKMFTIQQIMNLEWEPNYYKVIFSASDTLIYLNRTAHVFYVYGNKNFGIKFNSPGSGKSLRIPNDETVRIVYLKGADSLGIHNFGTSPATIWITAY